MEYEPLSWVTMLIGLAGGLALFLHGMTMMSNALRAMAGSRMKDIMARLAGNRVSALLTGAIATAVVQSSSVTTVIAIGFVSAGIMNLGQAIAVSMGGAVGSTLTAQIIAFDIGYFSLLLIASGFGLSMWKSHRVASLIGTMILGLGVLFVGLSMMSEFMSPLRSYQPFIDLMASMSNPLLGILLGAAFTAIVQSSSATLGVIIALASQGLIPLTAGIALVFGANIGTTVTALLATIGQPRSALHTAIGHVSFKVLLVLIWLPLIGPLEQITRAVSPSADGLVLAEQLAYGEIPTKNRRTRTLAIDDLTVTILAAQLAEVDARAALARVRLADDPYVFTDSADGSEPWKPDTISQYFGRVRKRVGLDHLDFHDLRKFMETYGQEMGYSVTQVAMRAGHDPSIAAKHYSGRVSETDRALAAAVASLIAPRSVDGRASELP